MKNNKLGYIAACVTVFSALALTTGCESSKPEPAVPLATELNNAEVTDIINRSYQYVAMYNVNNKFSMTPGGGWNTCLADTRLKDHTMRDIARPNNDTLFTSCMLDLRDAPMIIDMPAFDSDYVSLMVTAYDHYVNVPLSRIQGDFNKPEKILFYTERTKGYNGEAVEGVDHIFEASGDFISAIFRVMPHANEAERSQQIIANTQSITAVSLPDYKGGDAQPVSEVAFPSVGATDFDTFGNNLLETMQFVFNHTSFDPNNEIDQGVLAAYKPLGVVPGQAYDASAVTVIDGEHFRAAAQAVAIENLAFMDQPEVLEQIKPYWMEPKGKTSLQTLVAASVIGPIGLPGSEAEYPVIATADGAVMNAMNDYVIRMSAEQLPPANAFWSVTLYDMDNGFFIPNDRKKYSVGQNGGMKLNKDGGLDIYIAATQPEGVPAENWLPINRKDEDLSVNLRIYGPDAERIKNWTAPSAKMIK